MTEDTILKIFIGLMGSSVAGTIIISLVQLYKWANGEKNNLDASSVKTISDAGIAMVSALRIEIDELKEDYKTIKTEFSILREDYQKMQNELILMKDWAERLAKQVVSLGGKPVKRISIINEKEIKN